MSVYTFWLPGGRVGCTGDILCCLTSCAYIDFGIILVLSILGRVRRGGGGPKALGIRVGKRVHLSPLYILLQGYRMSIDGNVVGGMRLGKVSRSNLLYDVRL